MKLHNAGKFDGDESKLPSKIHPKNAQPFKEPTLKQLSVIANAGAIVLMLILAIPFVILGKKYFLTNWIQMGIGGLLTIVALVPHEFLHAIWFKEDVYMYNDLSHGLLFVVGTEDMSKLRFILLSLCPNILFGVIPYIIFLLSPNLLGMGLFGLACIGSGFGDYINVFNTVTQVPRGAKVYLSGMHSYWYLPDSTVNL